jgi:hypothetical protein
MIAARKLVWVLCVLLVCVLSLTEAAKKAKEADPKECEVCIHNLESIDKMIPADKKSDKAAVEKAIGTHCTLSGFGSDWKPNPALTNPKDVKMCYIFEPIKKSISQPFSTGMPKKKVCERLKKENPEICQIKYPVKVEKKDGEKADYNKLKVKQLKAILDERGVKCIGCSEKADFVKKCEESDNMDL